MEPLLNKRLLDAIEFASAAHNGQLRKRSDVPYASHVFAVGLILSKAGYSEDVIIAGLLHDVIEDTKYSYKDIQERFGTLVADMVLGVTEDKNLPWRERKEAYRLNLEKQSVEVKAISAADLLANRLDIVMWLESGGDITETFHTGYFGKDHAEIDAKRIKAIGTEINKNLLGEIIKVIADINKYIKKTS